MPQFSLLPQQPLENQIDTPLKWLQTVLQCTETPIPYSQYTPYS